MKNIIFKNDFGNLAECLKELNMKDRNICIVSDENVAGLYYSAVKQCISSVSEQVTKFVFKPGEKSKNISTVTDIISFLTWKKFTREDCIIALGGGTVSDIAGLTASLYKRGIHYIVIPTTVLAQVDAAIGGKNGVDFEGQKNLIGTFYLPDLIYINTTVPDTLPDKEKSSGIAELIKTGIISTGCFDPDIKSCAKFKDSIIKQDFRDNKLRHILNFGHTVGHALEAYSEFSLLHGEAVGLGMICAFIISQERGWIEAEDTISLYTALNNAGLPVTFHIEDSDKIIEFVHNDKKTENGYTQFVLLKGLGNPVITADVSDDEIRTALESINE